MESAPLDLASARVGDARKRFEAALGSSGYDVGSLVVDTEDSPLPVRQVTECFTDAMCVLSPVRAA